MCSYSLLLTLEEQKTFFSSVNFFFLVTIGDRRRSLLRGLTESLSQILPLLYSVSLPLHLHHVQ